LAPILGYLCRVGAAAAAVAVAAVSGADVLLDQFARYLTGQRALTGPFAVAYCHWVRPFTEDVLYGGYCTAAVARTTVRDGQALVDAMSNYGIKG